MYREGFPEEVTFEPRLEGREGVHRRCKQREEHLKGGEQLMQNCKVQNHAAPNGGEVSGPPN